MLDQYSINSVLCKSFDTQLLYAALSKGGKVVTAGYLFRHTVEVPRDRTSEDVYFHAAVHSDIDGLIEINDGFFEDIEEVNEYLNSDGLFVLELNQDIVGCGISKAVVPGRIDIGMLVAKEHRNRGLGRHIVGCLKNHFLKQGLRPICGCAANNLASKSALEKAGFVSDHRLLYISY